MPALIPDRALAIELRDLHRVRRGRRRGDGDDRGLRIEGVGRGLGHERVRERRARRRAWRARREPGPADPAAAGGVGHGRPTRGSAVAFRPVVRQSAARTSKSSTFVPGRTATGSPPSAGMASSSPVSRSPTQEQDPGPVRGVSRPHEPDGRGVQCREPLEPRTVGMDPPDVSLRGARVIDVRDEHDPGSVRGPVEHRGVHRPIGHLGLDARLEVLREQRRILDLLHGDPPRAPRPPERDGPIVGREPGLPLLDHGARRRRHRGHRERRGVVQPDPARDRDAVHGPAERLEHGDLRPVVRPRRLVAGPARLDAWDDDLAPAEAGWVHEPDLLARRRRLLDEDGSVGSPTGRNQRRGDVLGDRLPMGAVASDGEQVVRLAPITSRAGRQREHRGRLGSGERAAAAGGTSGRSRRWPAVSTVSPNSDQQ